MTQPPSPLTVHLTEDYLAITFNDDQRALSSAVLNGGWCSIRSALNARVPLTSASDLPDPAVSLQQHAQQLALPTPCLGMMTAASMRSCVEQHHHCPQTQLSVRCWVTSGLSNARRCGDPADEQAQIGTINIWLWCSVPLSNSAMVEALMLVTEAKATALLEANILSPISQQPASGTGTDSHAIVCAIAKPTQHTHTYCGKHTRLGELIGRTALMACQDSIQYCLRAMNQQSATSRPMST
ncbi:MAG: adenosylcobinamide amidohydrolase [Bacterioplanes sp.]|nr:adenosylcobinamide amidohydrolase [Bacterioplanes sp.]